MRIANVLISSGIGSQFDKSGPSGRPVPRLQRPLGPAVAPGSRLTRTPTSRALQPVTARVGPAGRPEKGTPGREDQIERGERCRERKVRRPGSSAPHGLLRPTAAQGRRTSSLLLPPGVPPFENPFPFIGLSLGRPPPNDHHREAALLMRGTLHTTCRNRGRFGLQFGCALPYAVVQAELRRYPRREASGARCAPRRRDSCGRRTWPFPSAVGAALPAPTTTAGRPTTPPPWGEGAWHGSPSPRSGSRMPAHPGLLDGCGRGSTETARQCPSEQEPRH